MLASMIISRQTTDVLEIVDTCLCISVTSASVKVPTISAPLY
ncbi:MAG: hypothetical protein QME68_06710 [Elusimicrobiota bacterium]|nr:hypothetical protein [Elusimicrobiota bacterium]